MPDPSRTQYGHSGHPPLSGLIEAGSAAEPESTPFAVTLNGLQFSSEPTRFVYLKETTEEAGVDPLTYV